MSKESSKKDKKDIYKNLANFVYETAIHARTPRSGLWFLGSGEQSVSEHLFHTTMIAYALSHLEPKADKSKVILMALVHDIGEGRTSDHNYIHQRYGRLSESQAVADISRSVPFGAEISELFKEEQERKTLEAKIVKDADTIEWISTLRAEEVKGNSKAKAWIRTAVQRVYTKHGKMLAKHIIETHPDDWWFDEDDAWFVTRSEKHKKWGGTKTKSKKK